MIFAPASAMAREFFRRGMDGVGMNSRSAWIDTTSASGEFIFHIFSALAQFERRLIQERTKAGLSVARARGRKGGRKPITGDDSRVKTAQRMHKDHALSVKQICKTLDISRATFYRYLAITQEQSPLV